MPGYTRGNTGHPRDQGLAADKRHGFRLDLPEVLRQALALNKGLVAHVAEDLVGELGLRQVDLSRALWMVSLDRRPSSAA
jgi:hypothetical protein